LKLSSKGIRIKVVPAIQHPTAFYSSPGLCNSFADEFIFP